LVVAVPSMSALMGFGGQTVQGKPQEELMERVSLEWQIFGGRCSICFFCLGDVIY